MALVRVRVRRKGQTEIAYAMQSPELALEMSWEEKRREEKGGEAICLTLNTCVKFFEEEPFEIKSSLFLLLLSHSCSKRANNVKKLMNIETKNSKNKIDQRQQQQQRVARTLLFSLIESIGIWSNVVI